jgi:hypothetical protein
MYSTTLSLCQCSEGNSVKSTRIISTSWGLVLDLVFTERIFTNLKHAVFEQCTKINRDV